MLQMLQKGKSLIGKRAKIKKEVGIIKRYYTFMGEEYVNIQYEDTPHWYTAKLEDVEVL